MGKRTTDVYSIFTARKRARVHNTFPNILSRSADTQLCNDDDSLTITLPDGESQLLWRRWPQHVPVPPPAPGDYHAVQIMGRLVAQPRQTKCYGSAYRYSGSTHPVEAHTPSEIQNLYDVTNEMFGHQPRRGAVNMCLENHYPTGRHYISEHSDDEPQFGELHNVYCWVTGPASRVLVIRHRKNLVPGTPAEREVLRVELPAGLYVMAGASFQRKYTHEFPQLHASLFTRLTKMHQHAENWPTDGLAQAEWLKEHAGAVSAGLGPTDRQKFADWCLSRTSYTLRCFNKS
jgi:hypothetical protein